MIIIFNMNIFLSAFSAPTASISSALLSSGSALISSSSALISSSSALLSLPSGFNLFGLHINFYGIISALGYLLAVILTTVFAKKRGFKTEDILTLALYVIPLAIVGARLGFVLFKLENYHNFWDIFKIWEGGLMFYGGLVGGVIGLVLYCLIHKKNFLALADAIVPALLLGQALGRWGNFFNQEAYGTPVTNPAWQWFPFAVYIDNCTMADCTCAGSGWHLATFFYESLWNLLCFAVLVTLLYKANFRQNGCIGTLYLVLYGIGRIFIEGLRTDSLYLGSVRVSQLISGIFIVVGTAAFAYFLWKDYRIRKGKPTNLFPKKNKENDK